MAMRARAGVALAVAQRVLDQVAHDHLERIPVSEHERVIRLARPLQVDIERAAFRFHAFNLALEPRTDRQWLQIERATALEARKLERPLDPGPRDGSCPPEVGESTGYARGPRQPAIRPVGGCWSVAYVTPWVTEAKNACEARVRR